MTAETSNRAAPAPTLRLIAAPPGLAAFASLLRAGVEVEVPGPAAVRSLLCAALGLEPLFVEERVATVFVNGQPVDDLDTALVRPGDSVALAAAMPGIAGATMRRNSPVKALRADITHPASPIPAATADAAPGLVTLKLFNFIALEAGPQILARGVLAPTARIAEAARTLGPQLRQAELDGRPLPPGDLPAALLGLPGPVRLVVVVASA